MGRSLLQRNHDGSRQSPAPQVVARPDALELRGLVVMAHEGAAGDRLAVSLQQQEIAERWREGFGRITQDLGARPARSAIDAVAAVILGDEAFEQSLRPWVERR